MERWLPNCSRPTRDIQNWLWKYGSSFARNAPCQTSPSSTQKGLEKWLNSTLIHHLGLYDTQGTLSGLYLEEMTSPLGVNFCKPYSKLCTTSPTNSAPTAVHVKGTNREPPFEYSYSVKEKTVPRAPPIERGMSAHCGVLALLERFRKRDVRRGRTSSTHSSGLFLRRREVGGEDRNLWMRFQPPKGWMHAVD